MSKLKNVLFSALLFIIVMSASSAFIGNIVGVIQNHGREEHEVYAYTNSTCVSSPPFSSDFGPVVLPFLFCLF